MIQIDKIRRQKLMTAFGLKNHQMEMIEKTMNEMFLKKLIEAQEETTRGEFFGIEKVIQQIERSLEYSSEKYGDK